MPCLDAERHFHLRPVGIQGKYAQVSAKSDVAAGVLYYTRHDNQVQILVGKRDDCGTWCSFGGNADKAYGELPTDSSSHSASEPILKEKGDPSIAHVASRESGEESNWILSPHPRDLVEAPFHDLWTLTEGGSSLFRLYIHEIPPIDPRAFLERQKYAHDGFSREYTEYDYISLTQFVTNHVLPKGMELLPDFERLLRLIGKDILKAVNEEKFNEWRNDGTILTPCDGILVDVTEKFDLPDYGERSSKFSPFALKLKDILVKRSEDMPNPEDFMGRSVLESEAVASSERGPVRRKLSPTENHIRMILQDDFKDARDAAKVGDVATVHRDNLTAFLAKFPFRVGDISGAQLKNVKYEEAVRFLLPVFLREIDLFEHNKLSNYHATEGAIAFLWGVWGQIRAVLTQNHKESIKFRGHDLYMMGRSSNIADLHVPQGDYEGVNADILLCVNSSLVASPQTSLSTSSSAEYACTNHTVNKQNLAMLHQEATELLGLVGDFGPYYSLYHQYLAFRGNYEGCNGAICQITIPQAYADRAIQWGYHGRPLVSPTTWSTLLPALETGPEKNCDYGSRIPIVTEGRFLVHPDHPIEVRTTYYDHPSTPEMAKLGRQIRRLAALDAVDMYLEHPKILVGAMINAPERWALFDDLESEGVAPYILTTADVVSEATVELLLKCEAYDVLKRLNYAPECDFKKILGSQLLQGQSKTARTIQKLFFEGKALQKIFSGKDLAQLRKDLLDICQDTALSEDGSFYAYLCEEFPDIQDDTLDLIKDVPFADTILNEVTKDYLRQHGALPNWDRINELPNMVDAANAYLDQGGHDKTFLQSIANILNITDGSPENPSNALYLRLLALPYIDGKNIISDTPMTQRVQDILNQRLRDGTFTSGYMRGIIAQMMGYSGDHDVFVGPLDKLDPQDLQPYQEGSLELDVFGGSLGRLLEWMQRQPQTFRGLLNKAFDTQLHGSYPLRKLITTLFLDEDQPIGSVQDLRDKGFRPIDWMDIKNELNVYSPPSVRLVAMIQALHQLGVTDFSGSIRQEIRKCMLNVAQGKQVDVAPQILIEAFKITLDRGVSGLSFVDVSNTYWFGDQLKAVARYCAEHGSIEQLVGLTEGFVIEGYLSFLKAVSKKIVSDAGDRYQQWLAAERSNGIIWSVQRRFKQIMHAQHPHTIFDSHIPLGEEDFRNRQTKYRAPDTFLARIVCG